MKESAVVSIEHKDNITKGSYNNQQATIIMDEYKPNYLSYTSSSKSRQLAIFSEIYYHDWQAYIDGKPVNHIRANYILRGLEIPPGNHKIEFKFEPQMIMVGNMIGLVSFIIILLALSYGVYKSCKEEAIIQDQVA